MNESVQEFKQSLIRVGNKELLERYKDAKAEEKQNFLNTKWREETLPFVEAIQDEVLRRMGGEN